ncbi:MAG: PLP-dependent aminotransferase family protein [Roseburia sp.]|nr:PLP-dependent aminotransferase family protein [Roseburia sp.]
MLTYDLNQRDGQSLYEYLYRCIKQDILDGTLAADSRLPSKRELAGHHQISLKTVENAYEQLLTEGYIYSEEKRGYFVSALATDTDGRQARHQNHVPFSVCDGGDSRDGADTAATAGEGDCFADFTANHTAVEKFPYDTWAKLVRGILSQGGSTLLRAVPFQGLFALRVSIAKYLYGFRGMQVSPDQIVIGAGTDYLCGQLIQLLGRGCIYALEDPGYRSIAKIYQANDASYEYVSVDESGLRADLLGESRANIVHVSPGHHFPTGGIMPIARRQQLLDWAEEDAQRYIIEDDYDSEFRFSRRPIPAIQSLRHNHRVIYLNTFSKTLAPAIQISYMVLPQKLMERYASAMRFSPCTVSALEQYALAEFMDNGYFERHIHRMKKYYRAKRDRMLRVFEKSRLCPYVTIEEKDAGNHFLMRLNTTLSDTELKWLARENGVRLDCLSEYCERDKEVHAHTIIVNYSDLEEERFQRALDTILSISFHQRFPNAPACPQ